MILCGNILSQIQVLESIESSRRESEGKIESNLLIANKEMTRSNLLASQTSIPANIVYDHSATLVSQLWIYPDIE